MKRTILITAFVITVIIGALFIFTKKGSTPSSQEPSTNTSEITKPNETNDAKVEIVYTDDGFNQNKINAKVGDVISVKNQSNSTLQFSSDPHPVHTSNKDLNQQSLPAGGSLTFTVTKKGTFGFHNHIMDKHTGTIVVD